MSWSIVLGIGLLLHMREGHYFSGAFLNNVINYWEKGS